MGILLGVIPRHFRYPGLSHRGCRNVIIAEIFVETIRFFYPDAHFRTQRVAASETSSILND